MRIFRIAVGTAITGTAITVAYTAVEATAAAAGIGVPDGIRTWVATLIGLTTLGPLGLVIICRQGAIISLLTEIRDLLADDAATRRAGREFDDIKRRLASPDNVTNLFPKE